MHVQQRLNSGKDSCWSMMHAFSGLGAQAARSTLAGHAARARTPLRGWGETSPVVDVACSIWTEIGFVGAKVRDIKGTRLSSWRCWLNAISIPALICA